MGKKSKTKKMNDNKLDLVKETLENGLTYEGEIKDGKWKGYVAYPNIDLMSEMVDLMTASRSYEANVTTINAAKSLALRAIDLGR